jgi:hypothetical protein
LPVEVPQVAGEARQGVEQMGQAHEVMV